MSKSSRKFERGYLLIEVLIAMGIFTVGIATVGVLMADAYLVSRHGLEQTQAVLLAREGLEATRSIRDNNYLDVTAGSHGIATSSAQWIFSGTSDTRNQFTRQITVTDVTTSTKK